MFHGLNLRFKLCFIVTFMFILHCYFNYLYYYSNNSNDIDLRSTKTAFDCL